MRLLRSALPRPLTISNITGLVWLAFQANIGVLGFCRPGDTCDNTCEEGTIPSDEDISQCVECPGGKIPNNVKTKCELCPEGKHKSGIATCSPCGIGTEPSPDRSSCDPCKAGYKATASEQSCTQCAMGRFAENATRCSLCDAGKYRQLQTDTVCQLCSTGKVSDASRAFCEDCPLGSRASPGDTHCKYCAEGFVTTADQGGCMKCPNGLIPDEKHTECVACPSGQYSNAGDISCQDCGFPMLVYDNQCIWWHLLAVLIVVLCCTCCCSTYLFRRCSRRKDGQPSGDLEAPASSNDSGDATSAKVETNSSGGKTGMAEDPVVALPVPLEPSPPQRSSPLESNSADTEPTLTQLTTESPPRSDRTTSTKVSFMDGPLPPPCTKVSL